jgi:hypothetical protein
MSIRQSSRLAGNGESFQRALQDLIESEPKDGIRAFAVHPGGIVATDLAKYISHDELRASGAVDDQGKPVIDPSRDLKTPEQGAARIVLCATSPQLEGKGGVYCENVDIATISSKDPTNLTINDLKDDRGVMPYAVDSGAAHRLWELSEKLSGILSAKAPPKGPASQPNEARHEGTGC